MIASENEMIASENGSDPPPMLDEAALAELNATVSESLPVNEWRYLAKTCWGGKADGALTVKIEVVGERVGGWVSGWVHACAGAAGHIAPRQPS